MDALGVYVLTFNCARNVIDVDSFADHFFDALPASGAGSSAPDLIFLSLQEIAPIAYSFLGGSLLLPYFNAFRRAVQKASAQKWDQHYVNFLTDNTGMTGLMLFARDDTLRKIAWKDTAHVGVGLQQMGNKGAVGARLGYVVDGHSSKTVDLTFVAAHLAPMEDSCEQRNQDWQSIVERLVFTHDKSGPTKKDSVDESTRLLDDAASAHAEGSRRDLFAPNAYLFLAGDLNYRTSDISPSTDEIAQFPRHDAHVDDPTHYSHLLKKDQLKREMNQGRTFHGLSEAPIDFPPTYKYSHAACQDVRQGLDAKDQEWKWSTHRWPSWCDRILYLEKPTWVGEAGSVTPLAYTALPLFAESDHRPVALVASIPLNSSEAAPGRDLAPFSIDPSWEAKRDMARRKEVVVGGTCISGADQRRKWVAGCLVVWDVRSILHSSILVGGLSVDRYGEWR
ncbi:Endonuclease/exonuclease/phosphatase [Penicillium bovifimosum]|uniref:Endonuclease/exonuclease/phosphatase n=1 Tax=Penicillium bovifimosum TaxID=126998 RepID=A0A9W9LAZ4_9EURO|nr:Endonuclease/exonuclease/phosphatase [Penicillium bovifimosum]KAJ5145752.1 Endonuclease/exonuclease/phosphatase [Penicillium bovifimosum]